MSFKIAHNIGPHLEKQPEKIESETSTKEIVYALSNSEELTKLRATAASSIVQAHIEFKEVNRYIHYISDLISISAGEGQVVFLGVLYQTIKEIMMYIKNPIEQVKSILPLAASAIFASMSSLGDSFKLSGAVDSLDYVYSLYEKNERKLSLYEFPFIEETDQDTINNVYNYLNPVQEDIWTVIIPELQKILAQLTSLIEYDMKFQQ